MGIDLEMLKKKYRKKTRANIVELDQLQIMVPVLIREICRLEEELKESESYVKHLERKQPPKEKKGESGNAKWDVCYDTKKNRLRIRLSGQFDYKAAKTASNAVISVLATTRRDFDVINDIREVEAITDLRTVFQLRKVNYLMGQSGVNRIVRVFDIKNKLISAIFQKNTIKSVKLFTTQTIEEAEEILNKEGKFLKQ